MGKHIHIIGIAGVATSAIAIALKNASWKVTGSDKGFFPPVSTALADAGISFYAGWHPEKMIATGIPDIVMIGGAGKSSENPETIFAKEKKIPIYSYPEILEKYFLRENSLVTAGTWGKSTTSALLSFIFEKVGFDPSYMFGGISLSQDRSAKITDGTWSIIEGDEYTGSQFDNKAKFFHYHPTHLLLTSVLWDHADVYPTSESYFDAFKKLLDEVLKNTLVVVCSDNKDALQICKNAKHSPRIVTYGKSDADYIYSDVSFTKNGLSLEIENKGEKYLIESPLLGSFQAENIAGCFAMSAECGISKEKITESIEQFKGLKRRMEKRFEDKITVIDDIAHSPEKAKTILATLKEIYRGKIFAIFEPNIGSREQSSIPKFDAAFKDADEVIIPRLSSVKVRTGVYAPMGGEEIAKVISKSHVHACYIALDETLVRHLKDSAKPGDCIIFLGSHSFRGMIQELIKLLPSN